MGASASGLGWEVAPQPISAAAPGSQGEGQQDGSAVRYWKVKMSVNWRRLAWHSPAGIYIPEQLFRPVPRCPSCEGLWETFLSGFSPRNGVARLVLCLHRWALGVVNPILLAASRWLLGNSEPKVSNNEHKALSIHGVRATAHRC